MLPVRPAHDFGRGHPGRPRAIERGVRVRQPDRPADGRQCPRRVRGRPAVPGPGGGRRTRSRGSTTSTIPGGQVRVLGASVAARRAGEELPEEAYRGAYVDDPRGRAAGRRLGGRDGSRTPIATAVVGAWASERIRSGIEASLAHLGVHFDVWTSEASLHAEGWVERAVERLRAGGYVFEQDGATWFRSTDLRATTRTGSSTARPVSRRTSPPTSAT